MNTELLKELLRANRLIAPTPGAIGGLTQAYAIPELLPEQLEKAKADAEQHRKVREAENLARSIQSLAESLLLCSWVSGDGFSVEASFRLALEFHNVAKQCEQDCLSAVEAETEVK